MFFPRLRRQAKWVFVFLALVFAGGFVLFGVGSGSSGIGDLLRGNFRVGGSSGPSVSKAKAKIRKNPKDAQAYLDLATAQAAKADTDAEIAALVGYTQLRPRDADRLSQLASLYVQKARRLQDEARVRQFDAQIALAGSIFAPGLKLAPGKSLSQDPITQALSSSATSSFNEALTGMQSAFRQAEGAFKKLVALTPDDSELQFQLADSAESAGDTAAALAAYRRFLKLVPDDPKASFVKQQIKQLKAAATTSTGGTPSG